MKSNKILLIPAVFDLFHIGHLKLLNKLKKIHTDYKIIVALQEDASVKTCKRIPIMNTKERMDFIEELGIAYKVISYSNRDLSDLLRDNKVNLFIIGPEYGIAKEHIRTLEFCKQNNIQVEIYDRTPDICTSDIIKRCQLHMLS
jgi:cytidyltransferase-like protein